MFITKVFGSDLHPHKSGDKTSFFGGEEGRILHGLSESKYALFSRFALLIFQWIWDMSKPPILPQSPSWSGRFGSAPSLWPSRKDHHKPEEKNLRLHLDLGAICASEWPQGSHRYLRSWLGGMQYLGPSRRQAFSSCVLLPSAVTLLITDALFFNRGSCCHQFCFQWPQYLPPSWLREEGKS